MLTLRRDCNAAALSLSETIKRLAQEWLLLEAEYGE
jgi:hypothetical protein